MIGLNGCVFGNDSGTPNIRLRRASSLNTQTRLAGISAGPFWPWWLSSPANKTGTGAMPTSCRSASAWICVHARYAYGEMKSK